MEPKKKVVKRKVLHDPDARARMLDLIRLGHGRHAAARAIGVSPDAYRNYLRHDPEFEELIEQAVSESMEPVTAMLREKAINKQDVTAAKEYRAFVDREAPPPAQRVDVRHKHQIDLGALGSGNADALADLQARALERQAAAQLEADNEVVDAEVIEDTDDEVSELPDND
jgi:hypothetical protein